MENNIISLARSIKSDESLSWYLKTLGVKLSREEILAVAPKEKVEPPCFRLSKEKIEEKGLDGAE